MFVTILVGDRVIIAFRTDTKRADSIIYLCVTYTGVQNFGRDWRDGKPAKS